jgi:hypothetical protein
MLLLLAHRAMHVCASELWSSPELLVRRPIGRADSHPISTDGNSPRSGEKSENYGELKLSHIAMIALFACRIYTQRFSFRSSKWWPAGGRLAIGLLAIVKFCHGCRSISLSSIR